MFIVRYATKTLSILLILVLLAGFFLIPGAPTASAATQCYGDYTLLDVIENYSGCTGAQGMALDDTYIYNVKIASSTEDNAFITRTHRTSGATTYLTNASTGGYFFTNLYHANDLEMVTINGVQNLLVATGKAGSTSLVRFTLSGTKLTQAGTYTAVYSDDGTQTSVSSAQVMRVNGYVYDPSWGASQSGVYRWETQSGSLRSVTTDGAAHNGAAMSQGSISGTAYTGGRFSLHEGIVLKHSEPWIVEWKGSGNWTDGALLLSAHNKSKYEGNRYLFRRKNSTLIALGEYSDGTFYNYGLDLASYGIDGTANHVYRMTNKLSSDGSNMVYLSVDGRQLGPMNNYYLAGTAQGTTSNWLNGKDFTFSYFGTDQHPVDDCTLEYIQVWGKGLLDQVDEPDTYRWESGMKTVSATGLTANTATALGGSVSGSTHTDSRYALERNVVLLHGRPWVTMTAPGSTTTALPWRKRASTAQYLTPTG